MFNNTARKPYIIADTNALTVLIGGGGILSYLCRLEGGILSEGDFVRFPSRLHSRSSLFTMAHGNHL